ncbi:trifunctional MMPL family transporter/lysophospholipid acyltransferase/class I SAM-dependent methyltransferase [Chitinophaga japonensis]|uniref:1-acyl-sn-glycerol-3-phosphate acyltransferase n=1 Tax=Chitinophaga japonensis TaxID=104662 RepID=A0A562T4A8_CHIJA|nr:trifunctional MMPL family transporter/lysophospholipid acyltransferase/class I SAM-dependent methyltransferase [Chitinophaga japonensis]TWI88369.1 1-acyl-sn-glycerol-3-phosphate acyltransferase [Chitinophaga japonensis]
MGNFFVSIYNFFAARKAWLWTCAIACFALAAVLAARIQLEEDITRILPRDKTLDKLQQVFSDSRFADKLVLIIAQEDTTAAAQPDSLTRFAAELGLTLAENESLSPYIKAVQEKVQDSMMMHLVQTVQNHLPLFLEEEDYKTIDSLVAPQRLRQTLENNYHTLISPAGLVLKKMIQADPVGMSWIGVQQLQQLQLDEQYELYDGYIMTRDHRHLLMFVTPAYPPNATGKNARFLELLQASLDSLQQHHPATEAFYFGATAVSVGNAQQLRQDTLFTQGITVVLLIVLIAVFFRKKRAPLLVMLPVVFGALFSLACIYVIKGRISVIALGAGAVVLGIAVNYSLHVFNHYRHLGNIRETIRELATPMTIGSFTTVGGFLCLQFVQSPMLKDVGLFAALSLVGAALFSLIFLPHWITSAQPHIHTSVHRRTWLDKLAAYRPEKNKYLVIGILLLTVLFCFTAGKVGFESDMMRLNFMRPELKAAESRLNHLNAYTAQSVYVVTEGRTLEDALRENERMLPVLQQLEQQGIVKRHAGVGGLVLSEQAQRARIARWNRYWTAEKKQQLIATLQQQGPQSGFSASAFTPFAEWLQQDFTVMPAAVQQQLLAGAPGDYITRKQDQVSLVTLLKVGEGQKQAVYDALASRPHTTVLDKQYAANRLAVVIRNEFNSIAWMTSLLVFFALLLSYGRIELALITFIPMLISWIWILGIMGMFGIRFNIVNIILSTFIFGLGDDYSIFTMDGLLQQYRSGKAQLPSFRSSIFFSAITTMLGLGVLIFAKHPSLRSIALISIIGIGCVVVISQVLIPWLFNWLITNRVRKGYAPWTASGWTLSVIAFTYFTLGSFLLTAVGFVLIRLNPFNKQKGKYLYHVCLSWFTWSQLHIMGNIKKRVVNPLKETLEKPAVIISNHQSFLDILISVSLNPKVILLTNEWVWRSPVFGAVVRLAEYYPVAEGVEASVDKLRGMVEQGYSIVIYPEGTRSPDPVIKRFHKGAFYLAEQLGLDILPVLIHGTAYNMSKGDFLLKNGTITAKYLPRIHPQDADWGEGYAARTKKISRYFRQQYEALRQELETPAYFREQLIYNYIYKGPVLEWYMRIKTRLEKNYALFHCLLPEKGRIMDIGCGYGFMSYMLHFLAVERIITGVDYDEDKIAAAQHCYLKNDKLDFVHADIVNYTFGKQDAFIISDVLHYLQPEEQAQLLQRCLDQLEPGGVIVVRDGDAGLDKRHQGTRLTEFFSTRVLGFNKTKQQLSFFSAARLRQLVTDMGASLEEIDQTKYTSNVVYVISKSKVEV